MKRAIKLVLGVVVTVVTACQTQSMDSRLVPGTLYEELLLESGAKYIIGAFAALGVAPENTTGPQKNLYNFLEATSNAKGLTEGNTHSLDDNKIGGVKLDAEGLGGDFFNAVNTVIFTGLNTPNIIMNNTCYDKDQKVRIAQKYNQLYVQGRADLIAKSVYDAFLEREEQIEAISSTDSMFASLKNIIPVRTGQASLRDYRSELYGIIGALGYAVHEYTGDIVDFFGASFARKLRSFIRTELINVSDLATVGKYKQHKVALDVKKDPTPPKENWDLFYDFLTAIGSGAITGSGTNIISVTSTEITKGNYYLPSSSSNFTPYPLITVIGAAIKRALYANASGPGKDAAVNTALTAIRQKVDGSGTGSNGGLLAYIPPFATPPSTP
jgi:hypothetical protein